MSAPDRLSLRQVAERLGWERAETLERLEWLHEKHGGLLFRRPGRGTKYWVDEVRLATVWPERFGNVPTAGDLTQVHRRIDHAVAMAERAMQELGSFRREVRKGRSGRANP